MRCFTNTTEFTLEGKSAVTLGKFDGLHLGHQTLLRKILERKKEGYQAVVFTFTKPPLDLLNHKNSEVLLTNEERRVLLERMGVDFLIEYPFTEEVAKMSPERFVKEILVDRLHAGCIAVGTDFRFGHERKGDYELLSSLGKEYGYQVQVVEKLKQGERDISSTYIKEEITRGNIEKVHELLGYPYTIMGEVLHGKKLGRTIGMPTANVIPKENKLLPASGVYASRMRIDGNYYQGVTNIGNNPTVGETSRKIAETYLFDFHKDIYGKFVEVELYAYERPEVKFHSVEELKEQVQKDIQFGEDYFSGNSAVDK